MFTIQSLRPNTVSNVSQQQGMVSPDAGGSQYSLPADTDVPVVQGAEYDASISRLEKLPSMISAIYSRLVAAGKDSDAWLLRDATERFANAGKAMGINAFGRARALAALQGRLTAAANTREAQISQQESNDLMNVQKELARLGAEKAQMVFSQGMQRANFRENKLNSIASTPKITTTPSTTTTSKRTPVISGVQPLVAPSLAISTPRLFNPVYDTPEGQANQLERALKRSTQWTGTSGFNWYDPNYARNTAQNFLAGNYASRLFGSPVSGLGGASAR